jgi:hypothetical protein
LEIIGEFDGLWINNIFFNIGYLIFFGKRVVLRMGRNCIDVCHGYLDYLMNNGLKLSD